jgi:hypothetical protein
VARSSGRRRTRGWTLAAAKEAKRQMRLEAHLAKTLGGLVQRIAQRLLALTLAIHINTLTGRPPRALAAYDGR